MDGSPSLVVSIPHSTIVSATKCKTPIQSDELTNKKPDGKFDEYNFLLPALQAHVASAGLSKKAKAFICNLLTSDFGRHRFCWISKGQATDGAPSGWSLFKKVVLGYVLGGGTQISNNNLNFNSNNINNDNNNGNDSNNDDDHKLVQYVYRLGVLPFSWYNMGRISLPDVVSHNWYIYNSQTELNHFPALKDKFQVLDISQVSSKVIVSHLPPKVILPQHMAQVISFFFFFDLSCH